MQVWRFYSSALRWRTHCFAAGTRRRPRPVRLVPGSLLGSSPENSVTGHRCKASLSSAPIRLPHGTSPFQGQAARQSRGARASPSQAKPQAIRAPRSLKQARGGCVSVCSSPCLIF